MARVKFSKKTCRKVFYPFLQVFLLFLPLLRFVPFFLLYGMGKVLGFLVFYLVASVRKRILSNLSLATDLKLSRSQLFTYGIESLQNLILIPLEMGYVAKSFRNRKKIVVCENPQFLDPIKNRAVIFLSAHQTNWELFGIDLFARNPAVVMGREMENPMIDRWLTRFRTSTGATMVTPKRALREGIRAMKKKQWFCLLGDQGRTDSKFSSDFLGRNAHTSVLAASIAFRMDAPIIFLMARRENRKIIYRFESFITPNSRLSKYQEIFRMTQKFLSCLEESIKQHPGQWFWLHNRWKQPSPYPLKKKYRYESILIIFPRNLAFCQQRLLPALPLFREIYPHHFLSLLIPENFQGTIPISTDDIITYSSEKDAFIEDYRFKLVFNFSSLPRICRHFFSLSALQTISVKNMRTVKSIEDEQDLCAHLDKYLLPIITD